MPGIMAALETNHDVRLLGQPVDDLAFAFVAPLRADNHHVRHEITVLPRRGAKGIPATCKRSAVENATNPRSRLWTDSRYPIVTLLCGSAEQAKRPLRIEDDVPGGKAEGRPRNDAVFQQNIVFTGFSSVFRAIFSHHSDAAGSSGRLKA
jgi:hypothetical protein